MKTAIQRRAREAFLNSLDAGHLDEDLVVKQVNWLSSFGLTERLKLLQTYRGFVETKINEELIQVFSSNEIGAAEKDSLEQKLKNKFGDEKEIVYHIDPSLIGGIRIKQKDNLFDYSIAGKLEQIKEVFA